MTDAQANDATPEPGGGEHRTLLAAVGEVEAHVAASGWDRAPLLFALVDTKGLLEDQPHLAAMLDERATLTPVEQEELALGGDPARLEEALAQIGWPESVAGCVLCQEVLVLPPSAEADLAEQPEADAATHPDRREVRMAVGVLRSGADAAVMRLRADATHPEEELVTGEDLAPGVARALLATLRG